MRISELLASVVIDRTGRRVGRVRDVLVSTDDLGITGLVVGDGVLANAAHAWGLAAGRAQGPWLLRKLMTPALRRAIFVPAEQIAEWGPGALKLGVEAAALPLLREMASR